MWLHNFVIDAQLFLLHPVDMSLMFCGQIVITFGTVQHIPQSVLRNIKFLTLCTYDVLTPQTQTHKHKNIPSIAV